MRRASGQLPIELFLAAAAALMCFPRIASAEDGTWPPLGQLGGGSPRDVAVQGSYAYVAAVGALVILDVSNPASPQEVGYWDSPSSPRTSPSKATASSSPTAAGGCRCSRSMLFMRRA